MAIGSFHGNFAFGIASLLTAVSLRRQVRNVGRRQTQSFNLGESSTGRLGWDQCPKKAKGGVYTVKIIGRLTEKC